MLRTISSPRLSPRFSLPCPREQSIGKIPPAGELVCRSARTFRVGEGGGNETERERERNVKRITDRDTGKNSSQKSRRWIVRAVYFTRMMHFCVCGCLISRKSWNIVVGALRGIDQIVAPLLTAFLFCFSFSFLFSPFYPPFESYCKINICFRF